VIVKGPSGKLLATTTLRKNASATGALTLPSSLTGAEGQVGIYEFSTSIPAGNGPYTIDLVGVSNTVVSTKQLDHLQLSCGLASWPVHARLYDFLTRRGGFHRPSP
jgi:hypothetical protein